MQRFLISLSIPLLFCALVAAFYRPQNTYLNQFLLEAFGNEFTLTQNWWRRIFPLTPFLVYSLPGGLWVLMLSLLGWRLHLFGFHLFYLGFIFGLGFELFQIGGMTDGTFDWQDLVAVIFSFAIANLCVKYWLSGEWRAQNGKWRYVLFFVVFFAAFGADVLG